MEFERGENPLHVVTKDALVGLLVDVERGGANPVEGIFGPDSESWKVNRESALFLGAGRAALLQLGHPWVAASLDEHSTLMARPIDRFHGTFRIVFCMIFGTLDQAMAAARHLHALHTRIQGAIPEDVAAYKRGSRYEANEVEALKWVYSTLVESAVFAYECAMGPLGDVERERYYAESRILAGLFGLRATELPENWEAFAAYNAGMHESNLLGVSRRARAMAHGLLSGAGSWIHPPQWYRSLTTEWMPERFREEFGLAFGAAEQGAAAAAKKRIPAIYKRLPAVIRFTGPSLEADARLKQRSAGMLVRWSNQFWIGQALLPFGDK
jgi:uncharacterized protein (DUF2236 family)